MTWVRDFSCNNVSCKNYKVKTDALYEASFCDACLARITSAGMCTSCGEHEAGGEANILFPWLCNECNHQAKEKLFSQSVLIRNESNAFIRSRTVSIAEQMPGPVFTLWIIIGLSYIAVRIDSSSLFASFILTLIIIMLLWMPFALGFYMRSTD